MHELGTNIRNTVLDAVQTHLYNTPLDCEHTQPKPRPSSGGERLPVYMTGEK